jgi:hypothetical protein
MSLSADRKVRTAETKAEKEAAASAGEDYERALEADFTTALLLFIEQEPPPRK